MSDPIRGMRHVARRMLAFFNPTNPARPMLKVGDIAPDIEAIATDGSTIRLSEYRGRNNVVIYFYPEDDTSGCTKQACDLRDAKPEFDATNTVILGVSTDDQLSHQKFTEKYSLNFPLLVDTDGAICDAFGVPHDGGARRVTFLIDTDGRIARVWEKVSVLSHRADLSEAIAALGHS
jgi:thioredoxin-dependent peroxiredoxin